ncbi:MAG TPA: hypothetical protein PLH93_09050 [Flavobacteriales bacterium]|nr:hypothetical protein [Flavobacteriales bacterium]HQW87319.1 hypothetical protein [Flavobacteriales bacterium]
MRTTALIVAACGGLTMPAQVLLDAPLNFTAVDSSLRQVDGLAQPLDETDLITLSTARAGGVHWASAGGTANAITLAARPPVTAYRQGLRLRFIPTVTAGPSPTLNVDGLGPVPVRGPEFTPPPTGSIVPGRLAEVIWTDSVFRLNPRPVDGCPVGFLQVHDGLCMQQAEGANVSIFTALRQCADRGARLCTWDEYLYACTVLGGQLTGVFNDWEWIDDTSDHTHTSNQAGRYYCAQQRAVNAVDDPAAYARARCCYHIR